MVCPACLYVIDVQVLIYIATIGRTDIAIFLSKIGFSYSIPPFVVVKSLLAYLFNGLRGFSFAPCFLALLATCLGCIPDDDRPATIFAETLYWHSPSVLSFLVIEDRYERRTSHGDHKVSLSDTL